MTCAPGTRLGPYEIRSARDLPGLGDVYDARDHAQRRDVAIRILRTDFGANPERLRRFEQDTRAAAALTHPNILTVHNIGTDAGAAYIVSEPLEGATLRESLNGGVLSVSSVIQYALQIAHGLAAAHGKGVVHGDLTPENILIAPDGRLKILGFGLAAVTHSESALTALRGPSAGVALGTLSYMSPEQVRGMAADHRSDIFTFGAILYETLSGARAFSRDNPVDTMTAILQPEPPELAADRDIPPVLLRVVDACLEKDPAARVATAAEIASVLHTLWSQRTPVAAAAADAGAPMRRLRVASWIVAVIGLVALAAAVTPATMRIVESVWLGTLVRLSPAAPPSSSPPTSPRPTSPLPSSTPPTSTPPPSTSTPPPAAEPAPPPRPTPPRSTTPAPPRLTPPTSRPPAPTPPRPARSAAPRPASRPRAFPPPGPARSAASPPAPAPSASGPPVFPPPAPTPSIPPRVAAGPQDSHLVWFGRAGAELGRVGEPADYGDVSLSPDGMRVAVSVRARGSDAADIWVVDLASEMRTRLTSDPADDIAPVWSPDGRRILFASSRKGSYDLYEAEVGGTGNETVIIDAPGDQIAYDWSSNGRYLVYQTNQPRVIAGGNLDLWMRAWPAGRPFAFLRTVHAASRATFSPDGTRVAYTSFEGGREDVYVAAFPRYDGRRRISAGGGSWSRWRRDGSEIFYLDPENRLVAVPVKRTASGVDAGSGRPLFATGARPDRGYAYDVSADGDRILVNTPR